MAIAGRSSTASNSILLINPPSPPGMTANREGAGGLGAWSAGGSGFLYPPQTQAYCAAVMRRAGWDVRLLDAAGERLSPDEALRRAAALAAPIVAVQVAHISLENDIAFLNGLCAAAPDARLLAIGNGMAFCGPAVLERTDVDQVVVGEPEAMLLPACLAAASDSSVPLHRTLTATAVDAPAADSTGRQADLDALPFPAWDITPWQRYGFLTIAASRGCDDTCAFCPYVIGQGRSFRARDPVRVVEEMQWLAATLQSPRVIVRDPVFAHERARVEQICRLLIARGVRLNWECESRPEHFDPDLLRLLKQAGCASIKLGFETTSETVLRALRRIPPTGGSEAYLQQTASVAAACHALGIACRIFVMTGLPGQTDDDIASTSSYLRTLQPAQVDVKAFHRYPGLPIQPADLDEERRRGARQEAELRQAAGQMSVAARRPPLQSLRRWLRKGLGR